MATVGCCPQSSSVSHVPLGMTFWGPACNVPGFPLQPLGILSCCQCPNFARCFSAGPAKAVMPIAVQASCQGGTGGLAEDTPSCWRTYGSCKADGLLCHRACAEMFHFSFPITFPLWGLAGAPRVWAGAEGTVTQNPLFSWRAELTSQSVGSCASWAFAHWAGLWPPGVPWVRPPEISGHKSCPGRGQGQ